MACVSVSAESAAAEFERCWEGALKDLREEQRRHGATERARQALATELAACRAENGRMAVRIGQLRKLLGLTKKTDPTRRVKQLDSQVSGVQRF